MRNLVACVAVLLLVAACGGAQATPSPTSAPTRSPATNAAQAADAALRAGHDSWQFTVTTYEAGTPNVSRTVAGTQIPRPSNSVSFIVSQAGKPDWRYVRVGNDVWFDTGTGSYARSKASDNYVNLQFQPYYLDGILGAAEIQGYDFQPAGTDTVSGLPATHYRLADGQVQGIVANMSGMQPADWAADVWISDADGSLLRLAWGPQSIDKAQAQAGFNYVVTALDCACPVTAPTIGGS